MRLCWLSAAMTAAVLCVGCGASARAPHPRSASVVLDFTPNAVHAGVYSAIAHRFDRADGVRLQVIVPAATTDSIKLLESGRVDFAILDIHDLAIARERGADIAGVMALVERPLSAVVASAGVRSAKQLEGGTVGITGVPSDTAVLRSIVAGAGGDPNRVRTITIGFNAVAELLARRIVAATAFWSDEGVTLALRRQGFHSFPVDRYGAPSYPELVLCAAAPTLARSRGLVASVVRTLERGYAFTVAHPMTSATDLESLVSGLDPKLVAAQLAALLPAFRGPDGVIGKLDPRRLRSWAAWEARFRIVSRTPDVARMFDPSFATAAPKRSAASQ